MRLNLTRLIKARMHGGRAFAIAAFVCLCAHTAAAQSASWTERPYDPPVGSRWMIVSESISDEARANGERREQTMLLRGELTIDEKRPDGFRVTYINRGSDVRGNGPNVPILQQIGAVVKDVPVRGMIDARGKPVSIENIKDLDVLMRPLIDKVAVGLSAKDPKGAEAFKRTMEAMLFADQVTAAEIYMGDMLQLTAGHNTGVRPGEVKRERSEAQMPFGGVVRSTLITRLTSWDDATGNARYARREEVDPETLKSVSLMLARRVLNLSEKDVSPRVTELVKTISYSVEREATITVENGMTRQLTENTEVKGTMADLKHRKITRKAITVTPLR